MEWNIKCLAQACDQLGLAYRFLDAEQNLLSLEDFPGHWFQLNRSPFNNETLARICKDKQHTYDWLHEQVSMPKTMGFLDYQIDEKYQSYLRYKSPQAILNAIEDNFSYPLVIKPNQGALGRDVSLCRRRVDAASALAKIFERRSRNYDYIALAQAYLTTQRELRIVFFRGEPLFAYERVFHSDFGAKYWEQPGGDTREVSDAETFNAIRTACLPAVTHPGLGFVGLDVVQDPQGQWHLLELNSSPQFRHFIEYMGDSGEARIVRMYRDILERLRG